MSSAETQVQPITRPGILEPFMYKNRLQQYAQRSGFPLPSYQTVNEGTAHAPKFRASVMVDGSTYWSPQTFNSRKAAEQDVARHAFEEIDRKIKVEGCPLIQENTAFCKSILNEFAVKMSLEKPSYVTSQLGGLLPTFISSIVFNERSFSGNPGRNKREAEQLAAHKVILSILGNSDSRTVMFQIIKSKNKLYAALQHGSQRGMSQDTIIAHAGLASSGNLPGAKINAGVATTNVPPLSVTKNAEGSSLGQPLNAQVPEVQFELKKAKEEIEVVSFANTLPVTIKPVRLNDVASTRIDVSPGVGHNAMTNASLREGSSVSFGVESQTVATNIGIRRASDDNRLKSKKVRLE